MDRIKVIFTWVWAFIKPFVKQLMSKVGPILAQAALAAVKATAANMAGASNDQKRDAAYALIVSELKTQGINVGVDVGVSMVNAALEMAVQQLKAKQ